MQVHSQKTSEVSDVSCLQGKAPASKPYAITIDLLQVRAFPDSAHLEQLAKAPEYVRTYCAWAHQRNGLSGISEFLTYWSLTRRNPQAPFIASSYKGLSKSEGSEASLNCVNDFGHVTWRTGVSWQIWSHCSDQLRNFQFLGYNLLGTWWLFSATNFTVGNTA